VLPPSLLLLGLYTLVALLSVLMLLFLQRPALLMAAVAVM
jgi:hypothetical protein